MEDGAASQRIQVASRIWKKQAGKLSLGASGRIADGNITALMSVPGPHRACRSHGPSTLIFQTEPIDRSSSLICLCPSHSTAVHSSRGLTAPSGHPCLVSHLITPAHFLHCHPPRCWGLSYVNILLSSKSPMLSSSPSSHVSISIPASWYPLGPCLSEASCCLQNKFQVPESNFKHPLSTHFHASHCCPGLDNFCSWNCPKGAGFLPSFMLLMPCSYLSGGVLPVWR